MRWISLAPVALAGAVQAQTTGFAQAGDPAIGPAAGDFAMLFQISNRVSATKPDCTVLVQAQWDPDLYLFGAALFDVDADSDVGAFRDPESLLKGPGFQDGDVSPDGDSVTGIITGQLCFPFGCDPGACPNPDEIWQATWSTDDFTPRIVHLATLTSKFDIYVDDQCASQSFVDQLVEGAGQIVVTCYADCDQSTGLGVLDLFDFLCFVNEFNALSPDADCDGDGSFSLFDFLCFVNEFNAGC